MVNVEGWGYASMKGSFSPNLRLPSVFPQERAADDSKEVESFQQLLNARTQVGVWGEGRDSPVLCFAGDFGCTRSLSRRSGFSCCRTRALEHRARYLRLEGLVAPLHV